MSESKIWVVTLECSSHYSVKPDTKYVRAKTEASAVLTAIDNSWLSGRWDGSARLATPEDLGCVRMPV